MPVSARFIIAANALFPSLLAHVMRIVNRFLPPPVSQSGDEAKSGAELRTAK